MIRTKIPHARLIEIKEMLHQAGQGYQQFKAYADMAQHRIVMPVVVGDVLACFGAMFAEDPPSLFIVTGTSLTVTDEASLRLEGYELDQVSASLEGPDVPENAKLTVEHQIIVLKLEVSEFPEGGINGEWVPDKRFGYERVDPLPVNLTSQATTIDHERAERERALFGEQQTGRVLYNMTSWEQALREWYAVTKGVAEQLGEQSDGR